MATDGALVALQPPNEVMVARGPQDPLQRLDETMAQTPEWARLRAILQESSPFVRNTISQALSDEMAVSYENVLGQLEALRTIKEDLREVLDSEEAATLAHLMRDIHPSDTQGLQREANGINKDIRALRSALEQGNMEELKKQAKKVEKKAKRFRDKFEEIRPKVDRLKRRLEEIGKRCKEGAEKSDGLIAEVENKTATHCRYLLGGVAAKAGSEMFCLGLCLMGPPAAPPLLLAGIAAGVTLATGLVWAYWLRHLGTGASLASKAAQYAQAFTQLDAARTGMEAVRTTVRLARGATAAVMTQVSTPLSALSLMTKPFISAAVEVIALACLGLGGRSLVKEFLASLWGAELKAHERTKAVFQRIGEAVQAAAEKLKSVSEKNDALELCLDTVVEAATELADAADDEEDGSEADTAGLDQQIQRLSSLFEAVPGACQQFSESVHDLKLEVHQTLLPQDLNDVNRTQRSILTAAEMRDAEVEFVRDLPAEQQRVVALPPGPEVLNEVDPMQGSLLDREVPDHEARNLAQEVEVRDMLQRDLYVSLCTVVRCDYGQSFYCHIILFSIHRLLI